MSGEKGQNLRKLQNHFSQHNSMAGNGIINEHNAKIALKSRSRKQDVSEESLSFEKQLVTGHWQDFLRKFQKCFPSIKNKVEEKDQLSGNSSLSKNEKQHWLFQKIRQNSFFNELSSEQFVLDLEKQTKLVDFLFQVQSKIESPLSQELIFLSFNAWELYLSLKTGHLEEDQFFQASKDSAKKFLVQPERSNELHCLKSHAVDPKSLNEFLLHFCVRIIALAEGYFNQALSF